MVGASTRRRWSTSSTCRPASTTATRPGGSNVSGIVKGPLPFFGVYQGLMPVAERRGRSASSEPARPLRHLASSRPGKKPGRGSWIRCERGSSALCSLLLFRRIFTTIPVMAFVALFVFLLLEIAPGDPAAIIAGDQGLAPPICSSASAPALGLDRASTSVLLRRYGSFLRAAGVISAPRSSPRCLR